MSSQVAIGGRLARLALRSLGAACGCGARAWSMALQRDLAGVTVRAELRSR
jgi:hypothetical protein